MEARFLEDKMSAILYYTHLYANPMPNLLFQVQKFFGL